MRDEAMRKAVEAGLSFQADSGPTADLLAKVGLSQDGEPVEIDAEKAREQIRLLEELDRKGRRLPALFFQ